MTDQREKLEKKVGEGFEVARMLIHMKVGDSRMLCSPRSPFFQCLGDDARRLESELDQLEGRFDAFMSRPVTQPKDRGDQEELSFGDRQFGDGRVEPPKAEKEAEPKEPSSLDVQRQLIRLRVAEGDIRIVFRSAEFVELACTGAEPETVTLPHKVAFEVLRPLEIGIVVADIWERLVRAEMGLAGEATSDDLIDAESTETKALPPSTVEQLDDEGPGAAESIAEVRAAVTRTVGYWPEAMVTLDGDLFAVRKQGGGRHELSHPEALEVLADMPDASGPAALRLAVEEKLMPEPVEKPGRPAGEKPAKKRRSKKPTWRDRYPSYSGAIADGLAKVGLGEVTHQLSDDAERVTLRRGDEELELALGGLLVFVLEKQHQKLPESGQDSAKWPDIVWLDIRNTAAAEAEGHRWDDRKGRYVKTRRKKAPTTAAGAA